MKIFSLILYSITFPLVYFLTLLSSRSLYLHYEKKSSISPGKQFRLSRNGGDEQIDILFSQLY